MAKKIELEDYPLQYIITEYWEAHGKSIKKVKIQDKIYGDIVKYLSYVVENYEDLRYLDYTLKFDKLAESIEIKADNIITALWFINIFPHNVDGVARSNKFILGDGVYKFNKKTKKLIWTKNK